MTKSLICTVTVLVYVAFQIPSCESVTTISVNPAGTWTAGQVVTLTCTISPYSGEMKWIHGSTDVAKCTPATCVMINTGEGTFAFGFDTTNRIFTWIMNPVKSSYTGNDFSCYDGTNTTTFTATVKENQGTTSENTSASPSTIAIIALVFGIIGLIFCVVLVIIWRTCQNVNGSSDSLQKTVDQLKNDITDLKTEEHGTKLQDTVYQSKNDIEELKTLINKVQTIIFQERLKHLKNALRNLEKTKSNEHKYHCRLQEIASKVQKITDEVEIHREYDMIGREELQKWTNKIKDLETKIEKFESDT